MAENGHTKARAGRASAGKSDAPPTPRRVRTKLDTLTDVRREMARLYREARGRKLDIADASRLANILALMGRLIEGSDLEQRLQELEHLLSKEKGTWPQHPHH